MTKNIFFLLLLFFSFFSSQAQSWQWGNRIGSGQSIGSGNWETVRDMATDANGNVYVLGHVAQATVDADGQTKPGNGGNDIVLASFSCNGMLRWWKSIGGISNDYTAALQADKEDGVYAAIYLIRFSGNPTINIDADTTFSSTSYKSIYLLKYDTAGNYKWLVGPQADTVTSYGYSNTGIIDLDVDDTGNISWFCELPKGSFANGSLVVSNPGSYILKYSKAGIFSGSTRIDINIKGLGLTNTKMKYAPASGKYYIAGSRQDVLSIGGNAITGKKFVAAFSASGSNIWVRQSPTGSNDGFYGKPAIDKDGNIYVGGTITGSDTFLTYTTSSSVTNITPFIAKLDSNGNLKWGRHALVNGVTFGRGGVALRNSGEVVLHGWYPGKLVWPGYKKDSLNLPPNSGYMPFITTFNTHTGKVLGIAKLAASGGSQPSVIISDKRNNIYTGGLFQGSITVNGVTRNKYGGESDWYVAKYGHNNCNCTNIPEPAFTTTTNGSNVSFSYTGSAATSISWDFDDGNTGTGNTSSHTYTDSGNYIVCVTATNACGTNTFCQSMYMFPTGIGSLATNPIKLYPNPVTEYIILEGVQAGTILQLTDIMGRKVLTSVLEQSKQTIALNHLQPGQYMVILTDKEGNRQCSMLVRH